MLGVDVRASQSAPALTVLMPVYNGEKYLKEAVDSIINQTFRDFEFLIINDGSSDGSRSIAQSYDDPRIRLVDNAENIGLAKSLNKGLALARGELIARMDADDTAMLDRFQCQIDFLEKNPDCDIVFTGYRTTSGWVNIPPGAVWDQIWAMLFDNPMGHATAMFRKGVILNQLGGYREEVSPVEDYDLWARALFRGIRLGIVPKILLIRRIHDTAMTHEMTSKFCEGAESLSCQHIQKMFPDIPFRMAQILHRIWIQREDAYELLNSPKDAWQLRRTLTNIISKYAIEHRLGPKWQDSQAVEFALRGATNAWYHMPQSLCLGLFYQLLGCLTINIHRPVFTLYLIFFLLKKFLKPKRRLKRNEQK